MLKYQVKTAREMIMANFDPRAADTTDDVLFLLTIDTLGEDAKYITEEEETGSYGLFGDRHYETVNDAKSYEGERDENDRSELEFLKIIRDVRDNEPQLFERISKIPTKARSGIFKDEQKLLTFFRKGGLKKFFVANGSQREPSEIIKIIEQLDMRRFFDEQSQRDKKHRQRADKKTILSCWVEVLKSEKEEMS